MDRCGTVGQGMAGRGAVGEGPDGSGTVWYGQARCGVAGRAR